MQSEADGGLTALAFLPAFVRNEAEDVAINTKLDIQ